MSPRQKKIQTHRESKEVRQHRTVLGEFWCHGFLLNSLWRHQPGSVKRRTQTLREWSHVTVTPNKRRQRLTPSMLMSSVATAGRDQNKPFKEAHNSGFWDSFPCHQPCHFLKSDNKVFSASHELSPSEKRAWGMEKRSCVREQPRDIPGQAKVSLPVDALCSPVEQRWAVPEALCHARHTGFPERGKQGMSV